MEIRKATNPPPSSRPGKPKSLIEQIAKEYGMGVWVEITDFDEVNAETLRVGAHRAAKRLGYTPQTKLVKDDDGSVLFIRLSGITEGESNE